MASATTANCTAEVDRCEEVGALGGELRMLGMSLWTYAFAVDGLLVDTGPGRLSGQLIPLFRQMRLDNLALTHVHEDHCGLASWLQRNKKVTPLVPEGSLEQARRKGRIPMYRRLFWGPRPAFEARPLPERLETESFSFRVLRSPGHTREHVCLLEESRGWLFSGDLYVRSRPKVIFAEESVGDMIDTLNRMLQLDFGTLFCAHAGIVRQGRQALQEKLDYLTSTRDKVLYYLEQGYPLKRIDNILFPKKPLLTRISQGEWSSLNMVRGAAKLSSDMPANNANLRE